MYILLFRKYCIVLGSIVLFSHVLHCKTRYLDRAVGPLNYTVLFNVTVAIMWIKISAHPAKRLRILIWKWKWSLPTPSSLSLSLSIANFIDRITGPEAAPAGNDTVSRCYKIPPRRGRSRINWRNFYETQHPSSRINVAVADMTRGHFGRQVGRPVLSILKEGGDRFRGSG